MIRPRGWQPVQETVPMPPPQSCSLSASGKRFTCFFCRTAACEARQMSTTCRLRTLDGSSLERTLAGQQALVPIQEFVNDFHFLSLALKPCTSALQVRFSINHNLHAVLYPG